MKSKFLFGGVVAILASGSMAHAGLFSTPLDNPGFEIPSVPGSFTSVVDRWAEESDAFVQSETSANMVLTPYGSQWGGLTGVSAKGAIYQQVGTFDANVAYNVSFITGDRPNKEFSGLEIELWAGGTPLGENNDASTLSGTLLGAGGVGAYLLDSVTVTAPSLSGTLEQSFDLSTGSVTASYTTGSPLWLRIVVVNAGGGQALIDNFSIVPSLNPPTPPEPASQSIGVDTAGDMILNLENLENAATSLVQQSDDMAPGSWKDRFTLTGLTDTEILVPSEKPAAFYRVQTASSAQLVGPNFVLLLTEDCSKHWYDLYDATYGKATPNVASLASSGLIFNNAFCHVAVCSAARSTLISGCDPNRIGVSWHRRTTQVELSNGLLPFPAYLKNAGYYTTNTTKTDYNLVVADTWDNVDSSVFGWRARPGDKMPFLHVHTIFTSHESSIRLAGSIANPVTNPASVNLYPIHPDTTNFRNTYATYFDMIKSVDDQVGSIVNALQVDGLLDDTFIIFVGDNGGTVAGSKGYIVNTGLHVPLVVRVPANWSHLAPVSPNGRVDGFVNFEDIGPTIMRLAGLGLPKQMDGKPFMGEGVTLEQVNSNDTVFSSTDRFDEMYNVSRSVQTGSLKYIRHFEPFYPYGLFNQYRYGMVVQGEWKTMFENSQLNATQSRFFEARQGEELYDMASDPFETNNLASNPAYASSLAELRVNLHQHVTQMPDVGIIPESVFLRENGHLDPVNYGKANQTRISRYVDIADLMLGTFAAAQTQLQVHLASADPLDRYWALTVCAAFGNDAAAIQSTVNTLVASETNPLVLARAAVFFGELGMPSATVQSTLKSGVINCADKTDSLLVLNDATHLEDTLGYNFTAIGNANIVGSSSWLTDRINHLGW